MVSNKVFITGATGHLGVNLVHALAQSEQTEINILCHRNQGQRSLSGVSVNKINGSILNPTLLQHATKDIDTIYHLAALITPHGTDNKTLSEINTQGVKNICEAALENGAKLIHVSSIHAYNLHHPRDITIDEHATKADAFAISAYNKSKAEGETIIHRYINQGLDAIILNPTAIIGPYDFSPSRMGQFFIDLYNGKLPFLMQGGFDWVDVRDVVNAMLQADQQGKTGKNYLLSGNHATIEELAELAHFWTASPLPLFYAPAWLSHLGIPFAYVANKITKKERQLTAENIKTLQLNKKINCQKAQQQLAYTPRSLSLTIRDLYAWLLTESFIKPNDKSKQLLELDND